MSDDRKLRIAAVGDLHYDESARGQFADMFTNINRSADILALVGDLTTHGQPGQTESFIEELKGVDIPIVTVLGNHDYEGEQVDGMSAVLADRGIHVLEGENVTIQGIGFAGVKGFAGGFDRGALAPFGEPLIKQFVKRALDQALALENALRSLSTEERVVLLHYAPITGTIKGEPEQIYPFLGSSRLLQPIETMGASVVFHGHAHHGSIESTTPNGTPVYNVSLPLLREKTKRDYRVWEVTAPERRRG